jgi:hypothetical protein
MTTLVKKFDVIRHLDLKVHDFVDRAHDKCVGVDGG